MYMFEIGLVLRTYWLKMFIRFWFLMDTFFVNVTNELYWTSSCGLYYTRYDVLSKIFSIPVGVAQRDNK